MPCNIPITMNEDRNKILEVAELKNNIHFSGKARLIVFIGKYNSSNLSSLLRELGGAQVDCMFAAICSLRWLQG